MLATVASSIAHCAIVSIRDALFRVPNSLWPTPILIFSLQKSSFRVLLHSLVIVPISYTASAKLAFLFSDVNLTLLESASKGYP
jgi:hypothetical protein